VGNPTRERFLIRWKPPRTATLHAGFVYPNPTLTIDILALARIIFFHQLSAARWVA
jgi:hypothetical protein